MGECGGQHGVHMYVGALCNQLQRVVVGRHWLAGHDKLASRRSRAWRGGMARQGSLAQYGLSMGAVQSGLHA